MFRLVSAIIGLSFRTYSWDTLYIYLQLWLSLASLPPPFLSCQSSCKFVTWVGSCATLCHVRLGRPLFLFLVGNHLLIFFDHFLLPIVWTCPYHFGRFTSIDSTISMPSCISSLIFSCLTLSMPMCSSSVFFSSSSFLSVSVSTFVLHLLLIVRSHMCLHSLLLFCKFCVLPVLYIFLFYLMLFSYLVLPCPTLAFNNWPLSG